MIFIAVSVCAVLACVALLHAYWGFGGRWPGRDARNLAHIVIGIDVLPSPAACLIVAILIGVTAIWPLLLVQLFPTTWPDELNWLVGDCLALVFIGRGLIGFTPVWRATHPRQPFASLDRRVYSPLSLLIGFCYLLLLLRNGLTA